MEKLKDEHENKMSKDELDSKKETLGHKYISSKLSGSENKTDSEKLESNTDEKADLTADTNTGSKKSKKRKGFVLDYKKLRAVAIGVALVVACCLMVVQAFQPEEVDTTYPQLLEYIGNGEIKSITVYATGNVITAEKTDGSKITVPSPKHDEFRKDLMMTGVEVKVAQQTAADAVSSLMLELPLLILLGILGYYLISSMGTMAKNYMQVATVQDGTSFDKVAGMTEIKRELQFAIDFLKRPKDYRDCGARVPKGMLMVGPPGTGKTLLAKAVAGEAGVPFIHTSGSDFCEMFAGLGAKRVRELFAFARTKAPCVVFIDEVDSLGAARNGDGSPVARDNNQTLNALLKEMDGIGSVQGIFVMAATNTPDILDRALLRPGRFDRRITIGPPNNREDRVDIIDVHLDGKWVEEGLTPETISKLMIGFTGAEIEVVLNESVIHSLMNDRCGVISLDDINASIERLVTQGLRKKVNKNTELKRVAVHEGGHALMMLLNGKKVDKVTIIPSTSGIGGYTMVNREDNEEKMLMSSDELRSQVMELYGGLCAEEIVFGSHSNGCSNDLQEATKLLSNMITKWGMGKACVDVSEVDKKGVAAEIQDMAIGIKDDTKKLLIDNKEKLLKLANKLYDNETLSIDTIQEVEEYNVKSDIIVTR